MVPGSFQHMQKLKGKALISLPGGGGGRTHPIPSPTPQTRHKREKLGEKPPFPHPFQAPAPFWGEKPPFWHLRNTHFYNHPPPKKEGGSPRQPPLANSRVFTPKARRRGRPTLLVAPGVAVFARFVSKHTFFSFFLLKTPPAAPRFSKPLPKRCENSPIWVKPRHSVFGRYTAALTTSPLPRLGAKKAIGPFYALFLFPPKPQVTGTLHKPQNSHFSQYFCFFSPRTKLCTKPPGCFFFFNRYLLKPHATVLLKTSVFTPQKEKKKPKHHHFAKSRDFPVPAFFSARGRRCANCSLFFSSTSPPKKPTNFWFVCLNTQDAAPMTSPLAGRRSSFLGLSYPKTPLTRLLRREAVKKQTLFNFFFLFFWVQMPNSWDLPPNLLKPPRSPPLRR